MCCDEMENMEDVCLDIQDLNETYASNLESIEQAYDQAYFNIVRDQLIMRKQGSATARQNEVKNNQILHKRKKAASM